MRRGVASFVLVLVLCGCGSHRFAGMTRDEALRQSADATRTMTNVEALSNDFAQRCARGRS